MGRRPATDDELVGMLAKRDKADKAGNANEVARLDAKITTHNAVRAEMRVAGASARSWVAIIVSIVGLLIAAASFVVSLCRG